jgi:hypothetical protein
VLVKAASKGELESELDADFFFPAKAASSALDFKVRHVYHSLTVALNQLLLR